MKGEIVAYDSEYKVVIMSKFICFLYIENSLLFLNPTLKITSFVVNTFKGYLDILIK